MATPEETKALDGILDLIDAWQWAGRNGHCMPVIRSGELLDALEELADERRRDRCSMCDGSGSINQGWGEWTRCRSCEPMREGSDG